MLVLSSTFYNIPVISLRIGSPIGKAVSPVINPHNLAIFGWLCTQQGAGGQFILLYSEVREHTSSGLLVDDANALTEQGDLHRDKDVLAANFELLDKPVKTPSTKLGKVSDYAVDESGIIQKLYVEKSLIKALANDTLLIARDQITEVTDHYIMVADGTVGVTKKSMAEKFGIVPQSA